MDELRTIISDSGDFVGYGHVMLGAGRRFTS